MNAVCKRLLPSSVEDQIPYLSDLWISSSVNDFITKNFVVVGVGRGWEGELTVDWSSRRRAVGVVCFGFSKDGESSSS